MHYCGTKLTKIDERDKARERERERQAEDLAITRVGVCFVF